jgi:hypothetical protein
MMHQFFEHKYLCELDFLWNLYEEGKSPFTHTMPEGIVLIDK